MIITKWHLHQNVCKNWPQHSINTNNDNGIGAHGNYSNHSDDTQNNGDDNYYHLQFECPPIKVATIDLI